MLGSDEWQLQTKLQCDTQEPLKKAQGDQIRLEKNKYERVEPCEIRSQGSVCWILMSGDCR
jgi:hypothetical protein